MYALYIISIVVLGVMAIQDWKERAVSAWLFLPLAAVLWIQTGSSQGLELWMNVCVSNLVILTLELGLLWAYFRIRTAGQFNFFQNQLGLGDVIFFVLMATALGTSLFVIMLIAGCIFSLITHVFVRWIRPQTGADLPLLTYWYPVSCVVLWPGVERVLNDKLYFLSYV